MQKWVASKQNTEPAAKKLIAPQEFAFKELEEGCDNDKATTFQLQIYQPSIPKDIDMEELVPATSVDRHTIRDMHCQLVQSPVASKKHCQNMLGPATTDMHY